MGVAFSEKEMKQIRLNLVKRARECLIKYGVQKTSVKDIVSAAGISTGAFYRFFDSKELLFFEVMEEMENEVYDVAAEILKNRTDLVLRERVSLALLSCSRKIVELGSMRIWEAESMHIMRKVPPEALGDHYKKEGTRIARMISELGLTIRIPSEVLAEIIQRLLYALTHQMGSDPGPPAQVTEFMIDAICGKLFPDRL